MSLQKKITKKDIEGSFNVEVDVKKSVPIEDIMLFGRTKEQNAVLMAQGKLSVNTFMNEWYRRYLEDL